jgi:HlyD family secretion protein
VTVSNEPPPGHTREETEGVFVFRDGRAVFTPVRTGVAGEQYFEVLEGLQVDDQVITGPFASVRALPDGEKVKLEEASTRQTTATNP